MISLAILSPFLGMITSVVPSIIKIFERKQELQHEKDMQKLQLEASVQNVKLAIALEEAKADANEGQSLRDHDSALVGGSFINSLRASIRPVITYVFFGFFLVVKGAAAYMMLKTGMDIPAMLTAVWDQETIALFGAIIGFWFGSRTIERYKRYDTSTPKSVKPTK